MSKTNQIKCLTDVVDIGDLRRLAQRRLPRAIFDYIEGGAEDEVTMRENLRAFKRVRFRPRNGIDVPETDLRTTVLGKELAMPLLLAPCGLSRLFHPDGEVGAARAACRMGIAYTLSTSSNHSIEDVARCSTGDLWYQLYLFGGRASAEFSIMRARAAGFRVLMVTIDTAVAGIRQRDIRNGLTKLLSSKRLSALSHIFSHPTWVMRYMLDRDNSKLPNVVLRGGSQMPASDPQSSLAHAAVTWNDLDWLRDAWPGPIVAKGVLTGDATKRAIDGGCTGVIVSNHGGRQLDGVAASLRALPEVLNAAGPNIDVLVDGGIRRGSDILKALCLGARSVLIGRAYAYGLAAAGEAGVLRAITVLKHELETNLALLGCASVRELDRSYVAAGNIKTKS